ncbi:asparaginase [Tianweitania sp. BSSL-BM11]|uniref:Asparaginase n=1 Tax=Tianweitania aestuarii TaxID=2814886 RepID=A0ABS5RXL9_9HYPH|nr:asparaginase [Tianweitania aestuarii]MBS9721806.1 asparaginase [Tianweitania aestuarii]
MVGPPVVAIIGAGGTISSLAVDQRDYVNYPETGRKLSVDEVLAHLPELVGFAQLIPLSFRSVGSSAVGPEDWLRLHRTITDAVAAHPEIVGVVILHGTATLEETAFFLDLTLPVGRPVVLVGAQRPLNTVSSDAAANAIAAVRVAADPGAAGRGVMVVLNDEIHAARVVTKSSTLRLQTFNSGAAGLLGVADPDRIVFNYPAEGVDRFRLPVDVSYLTELPRVDICYAYAGSDGTAVRAFLAAGAKGLISAGFAPGMPATQERAAIIEASQAGIAVVQASRAGQGRVVRRDWLKQNGWIAAGALTPHKARILLMLGLLVEHDPEQLQTFFDRV